MYNKYFAISCTQCIYGLLYGGGVHVDVGVGGRRAPVMGCGGTIKKYKYKDNNTCIYIFT